MTDETKRTARDIAQAYAWAITPQGLETVLSVADRQGDPVALAAQLGRPLDNTRVVSVREGGVAVIDINGPMFPKANLFSEISGATSTQQLFADFATAMRDPMIKSIVLNIDSPGGAVTGINELSAAVFAARGIKPVVAYVGGMMASAAYWVGSGASQIVMDATAIAGSIGVRMSVQVASADPKITTHEIISSASPNKVQDISTEPGRASAQRIVDDLASVFVGAVASHRGVSAETVLADFGKGGVMVGAAAVTAGLADKLGSLEGVIAELQNQPLKTNQSSIRKVTMSTPNTAPADISAAVEAALVAQEPVTQNRISAAVKLAIESERTTAVAAERTRIGAINKLAQPGFDAQIKAAIESGASAGDTALAIMTAMSDRGITIGAIHKDSPPVIAGQPAVNTEPAKVKIDTSAIFANRNKVQ